MLLYVAWFYHACMLIMYKKAYVCGGPHVVAPKIHIKAMCSSFAKLVMLVYLKKLV